jgi:hypothetical protein
MAESQRVYPLRTDLSGEQIVIPASLTVLSSTLFANAMNVKSIIFEEGSQVRRLETGAFSLCTSLTWIRIAASVEFIGRGCFTNSPKACLPLKQVLFEAGSRLREIEGGAFQGCHRVMEICIPASVEKMNGGSLPPHVERVVMERGNQHFAWIDVFLMTRDHRRLLRCFDRGDTLIIPAAVEEIEEKCFDRLMMKLHFLDFEPNSRLRSIAAQVFEGFFHLMGVTIPSSVVFLGNRCFK